MDAATKFVLLTDIARSSWLAETCPPQYMKALHQHNNLVEAAVARHGGEILKHLGDGYLTLFDDPRAALEAAVELQLGFSDPREDCFAFPDDSRLGVRIVLHGGRLQRLAGQEYDWFGTALNRCSRISVVCHSGQLLFSGALGAALDGLPADWKVIDLGDHRLRDLAEPEHLYQLLHPGFAQQSFPPLATLDSRPNNLALQPNAFVGREAELAELSTLLAADSARLLTIIAPGGYGKSRIANQLCAEMLAEFGNGVFDVRLASLSEPGRLPEAIAGATGFQFFGNREPQQQILDYLREKEMLLHFDNFEHLLPAAAFVAEILRSAPRVRVLVTSREPLRLSGEQIYRLEPLSTGPGSESLLLFTDRATLVRSNFRLDESSSPLVEKICTQLEGVPLAIELAAAWADSFTLEEMSEELKNQLELSARASDLPARHRSVRASCDWSYGLLSPELQSALRRTSVFRGGFFADAGESVLGQKGMQLRKTLADLCDKGWLYTREIRWTILGEETAQTRYFLRDAAAHEYASEKLEETRGQVSV